MTDAYWLMIGILGAVVIFGLTAYIIKYPVRGIYLYIASSAILLSPSLPLVGQKLALPEIIILPTIFSIFINRVKYRLTAGQVKSILASLYFLLAIMISLFVSLLRFSGDYLQYSVIETLNYIYGVILFIVVIVLIQNKTQWENCIKAFIVGAGIISFVGVLAFFGHAPSWAYDEATGRLSSTLRLSNQVPSYLGSVLLYIIFLTASRRHYLINKPYGALLLVAIFMTMLGSGSRTALGIVVIGVMLSLYYVLKGKGRQVLDRKLLLILPMFTVIGFLVWLVPQVILQEGGYVFGETEAFLRPFLLISGWQQNYLLPTDISRLNQMELALESIAEYPMFGVGPAIFQPFYKVNEIHNTFLGVAANNGLLAFSLFVFWLGTVFKIGMEYAGKQRTNWSGVMSWVTMGSLLIILMYSIVIFGLRQRHFWVLAGLVVALPALHGRLQRTR